MKKVFSIIFAFVITASVVTGCGNSSTDEKQADSSVAEEIAEQSSLVEEPSSNEDTFKDINVYDFIFPATAKCEIRNKSENMITLDANNSEYTIRVMTNELRDIIWSESDMELEAKETFLVFSSSLDLDAIDSVPCEVSSELVNGFKLFTIKNTNNGETGYIACKDYNSKKYSIFLDGMGKKVDDYYENFKTIIDMIEFT